MILIGAFANAANVRNLRAKLAEKSIKIYVEPLDTPAGARRACGPGRSRVAKRLTRRWRR